MAILGMLLLVVGLAVAAVGGIWLIVVAFQESVLWGLGSLFIPLVGLAFVISHWDAAKRPFLINLGGALLIVLGTVLGGTGAEGTGAG
jgi:hypothetical protein